MIDLSGFAPESVAGRLLRLPLRLLPTGMVFPVLQGPLRGRRWVVGASTHGCWLGTFENEKQQEFARAVAAARVIFDIGANVGFYTLLAATVPGSGRKVFAFEPVPRNLDYLRRHLRLNRITNVAVYEKAVSDREGESFFDPGMENSMGHLAASGPLRVETVSLDGLLAAGEIPDPDLLKIDVEGAELAVLEGGEAMLRRATPTIFLATHGKQLRESCTALLRQIGYDIEAIGEDEFVARMPPESVTSE